MMQRLLIATLIFLATVLSAPALGRKIYPSTEPWAVPNVPSIKEPERKALEVPLVDPVVLKYMKALENRVYGNWEPGGLPPNKVLTVSFVIKPDGSFSDICLLKPSGIPQADFACLEAVSESSQFWKNVPEQVAAMVGAQVIFKLENRHNVYDCASAFSQPLQNKNCVVWHLIPMDALQCSKELDPSIVHSTSNLYFIKADFAHSQELQNARMEWVNFLRMKRSWSVQDLEHQAEHIERRYSSMFEKGDRIAPVPK